MGGPVDFTGPRRMLDRVIRCSACPARALAAIPGTAGGPRRPTGRLRPRVGLLICPAAADPTDHQSLGGQDPHRHPLQPQHRSGFSTTSSTSLPISNRDRSCPSDSTLDLTPTPALRASPNGHFARRAAESRIVQSLVRLEVHSSLLLDIMAAAAGPAGRGPGGSRAAHPRLGRHIPASNRPSWGTRPAGVPVGVRRHPNDGARVPHHRFELEAATGVSLGVVDDVEGLHRHLNEPGWPSLRSARPAAS